MQLTPRPLAFGAVRLLPLEPDHRERLRAPASDPTLWRWWPRPAPSVPAAFDAQFDWQLEEHAARRWLIHGVEHEGRLVGQTCWLNVRPEHASVEVGGTWYARAAQGGIVNPTCKLLMLGAAFEAGAERVELKTDALNTASRAAILKMGATFEGIHRRHMIRPDGTFRDTAWYAVIREEWPQVKAGLERRIGAIPAV